MPGGFYFLNEEGSLTEALEASGSLWNFADFLFRLNLKKKNVYISEQLALLVPSQVSELEETTIQRFYFLSRITKRTEEWEPGRRPGQTRREDATNREENKEGQHVRV